MMQLPTAEDILKKHLVAKLESGKDSSQDRFDAINDAMLEFARIHVKNFAESLDINFIQDAEMYNKNIE